MTNFLVSGSLHWNEKAGYGFDITPAMEYSGDYFAKYVKMDDTPMGIALTDIRVQFVNEYYIGDDIVDIGIGGGRFCKQRGAHGFDVSAEAVQWLKSVDMYQDPYEKPVTALTFWDSLEHIPNPDRILKQAKKWVFVSMPIYDDMQHCLASKHYKPGEHLHYWTDQGLISWFADRGFVCMDCHDAETQAGREGILSYAFKRI